MTRFTVVAKSILAAAKIKTRADSPQVGFIGAKLHVLRPNLPCYYHNMFSPLERDTPDTSDHSQDEGYPKLTTGVGLEDVIKEVVNGLIQELVKELVNALIKQAPLEPRSDQNHGVGLEKVPETIPEEKLLINSVDVLSRIHSDKVHGSNLFENKDIPLPQLLEKSSLSITDFAIEAQKHSQLFDWRYRILCYLICHNDFVNKNDLPTIFIKSYYYVNSFCKIIPKVLKKGWTYDQLDLLMRLVHTDLSLPNIKKNFPNHPVKDIRDLVNSLIHRVLWTVGELKYVDLYYSNKQFALENLPLRTKIGVEMYLTNSKNTGKRKIKNERKKIDQDGDIYPQNESESESDKELSEIEDSVDNEHSEDEEEFDKYDLNYCLSTDLTLNTITDIFPDKSLAEIVAKVKQSINTENSPLTRGEKVSMQKSLKQGLAVDSIIHQYPCRSPEFVRLKYKEFEFIANRKKHFKNDIEKLVYEAQWMAHFGNGEASGRSSRRIRTKPNVDLNQVLNDAKLIKIIKKREPTEEERLRRLEISERGRESRKRKQEEKTARKLAIAERMRQNRIEGTASKTLSKPKIKSSRMLADIVPGATHFQSVIGDKKNVEEGQKRKRVQVNYYTPEFGNKKPKLITRHREQAKLILKQATSKIPQKHKKKLIRDPDDNFEEFLNSISQKAEGITELEEDESNFDEVSPFDPTNISTDSLVPLNDRRLYIDEFYQGSGSIPKLDFEDSVDYKLMMNEDSKILYDDGLASHVIKSYMKHYRSLPVSFPPLFSSNDELNSKNILKIRFLIYPQHVELFVLAEPKSNELDPIYEIVKLFMIHFALYFSRSEAVKEAVVQYCESLEVAVENNSFSDFMFVVDKWNLLMLELSPNSEEVEKIKSKNLDINKDIRDEYLTPSEIKIPTLGDLNLELFYSTISEEESSPAFNVVEPLTQDVNTSVIDAEVSRVIEPTNISQRMSYNKPEDYNSSFFHRLRQKSDISRFAMHQILLRIYSRVVSTDSRKLRSYKAFTAEVYGELLPSFTSEVLEKVKLLPNQKFYDLGSGVGNTTLQAALEFGAQVSGGCELMEHASKLCKLQENLMIKHLSVFGLQQLNLNFALLQSFVDNEPVRLSCLDCNVLIINNYLFDANLNNEVGRLLYGLKTGTKIISLRNFIRPRYKANGDSIFDRLSVEKHEMSDFLSVSWTANKVPYYISTVEEHILPEYLNRDQSPEGVSSGSFTPMLNLEEELKATSLSLPDGH